MSWRGLLFVGVAVFCRSPEARADDATERIEILNRRADELQSRIDELGAKVQALREGVFEGRFEVTRVRIVHHDGISGGLAIVGVRYAFDGIEVLSRAFETGGAPRELEVFDGEVPAGSHRLEVAIDLAGTGAGLFSYTKTVRYSSKAGYRMELLEGRAATLIVSPRIADDLSKELKDRVVIRFRRVEGLDARERLELDDSAPGESE
ncbi:MAG: hypothetical protein HYV07_29860 [Deltaproteobacteria bacterium]|nr:hypothetical protein [Deltaproteobacteria bacterium]